MFDFDNNRFSKFEDKIWLASPTMHGDELEYIKEAYDTNWMSTIGKNIDECEKIVCQMVGCKYAVGLACGTAALHMAVKLAGVKPGDKVFCTDMTFGATVNPVVYEGGVPVFIDEERDTWNMDPVALEKAFQEYPDVKVVVAAHLYGSPFKVDEIREVCKKYGATLVEDAAESLGATYKGQQTGSFGDFNAISFNGNKIITGSAGGMFLTDDEEAYKLVRKWSTQSREPAPWYQHIDIGYNYRMSNVIGGVVRGQLGYLQEHIDRKKEIYFLYKEEFEKAGLPVSMNPYEGQKAEPNFWLSCMLIDEDAMCTQTRGDLNVEFIPEKGKSCPTEILDALTSINAEGRPIWKPMHMQPIYKENDFFTKEGLLIKEAKEESDSSYLNVGADIFQRGLCLPSDIKMTKEQQMAVIEVVKACFE